MRMLDITLLDGASLDYMRVLDITLLDGAGEEEFTLVRREASPFTLKHC